MKSKIVFILTLISAICAAVISVLTASCASYLITTKQSTGTEIDISTTNKADSVSVKLKPNVLPSY